MRTIAVSIITTIIILKLTGNLPWNWFWTLCPLIAYVLFTIVLFYVFHAQESIERARRLKANQESQANIDSLNQRIKDLNEAQCILKEAQHKLKEDITKMEINGKD